MSGAGEANAAETFDVVVIGGGAAGLAAASSAAVLGRSVVLLEKNPALGGQTSWSVGSVSATCTPHQIREGIKDSPQHHWEDLKRFGGDLAHRDNVELARVLCEHMPETFRWLLSTGLDFIGPMPEPPHRVPRMHNVLPNSRAFAYHLGRHCVAVGVDIRHGLRARRLVPENGRIAAVEVEADDGSRRVFRARGGVILATGDFSASPELKARYGSELVAQVDPINPTSTGDGHVLALDHGAEVVNGDYMRGPIMRFVPPAKPSLMLRLPPARLLTRFMAWSFENLPMRLLRPFMMRFLTTTLMPSKDLYREGAVLIDQRGLRFADELDNPDRPTAMLPEGMAWIVFDATVAEKFSGWPYFISTAPGIAYAYLDDYRRTRPDIFFEAPTLEALAARFGAPGDALRATIEAYNAGSGPARRGEVTRRPLARGPYYALGPAKSYVVFTNGGLRINDRMEVLRAGGAAIPGLYAAGSTGQGGMLLEGHGHHLGWAFVSGRLSGRNAAFAAV